MVRVAPWEISTIGPPGFSRSRVRSARVVRFPTAQPKPPTQWRAPASAMVEREPSGQRFVSATATRLLVNGRFVQRQVAAQRHLDDPVDPVAAGRAKDPLGEISGDVASAMGILLGGNRR